MTSSLLKLPFLLLCSDSIYYLVVEKTVVGEQAEDLPVEGASSLASNF